MKVVVDTSPLNYLILIQSAEILPDIFAELYAPEAVMTELSNPKAPAAVRHWIARVPKWLKVQNPRNRDAALDYLGAGERDAIALAVEIGADAVVVDERVGTREARQRNLQTVGTLAVIDEAGRRGLLDFNDALVRLQQTSFRVSPAIVRTLVRERRFRPRPSR